MSLAIRPLDAPEGSFTRDPDVASRKIVSCQRPLPHTRVASSARCELTEDLRVAVVLRHPPIWWIRLVQFHRAGVWSAMVTAVPAESCRPAQRAGQYSVAMERLRRVAGGAVPRAGPAAQPQGSP